MSGVHGARGCGSAGKTELSRGPHDAARERARGQTVHGADKVGPQRREREWARAGGGGGLGADRLAPPGRGREGARVYGRGLSLTGGTHLSSGASTHTWPTWLGWAELG